MSTQKPNVLFVLGHSPGASASLPNKFLKFNMLFVSVCLGERVLELSTWSSLMQESSANCSLHGYQAAVGGVGAL